MGSERRRAEFRLLAMSAAFACAAAASVADAELVPGAIFGDNMVLQRDRSVAVWGKAVAGDVVTVAFDGATAKATAAADGAWRVNLPARRANAVGGTLEIAAGSGESVSFTNVVVGEVWLCSGQSNMNMSMWGFPNVAKQGDRETNGYLDMMMTAESDVRGVKVPNVMSCEPRDIPRLSWTPFAPGAQRRFSAIAFHYALILHRTLKVPVGVVQSAWGGSRIDPWIPPAGFESEPSLAGLATRPIEPEPAPGERKPGMPHYFQQPRSIYNAMIHPLAPFSLRGALWYQGEANLALGREYAAHLRALRFGWSKVFENPDMPFLVVQIAPYGYMKPGEDATRGCEIWEAQAEFARTQKNCGMVATVDIGEIDNIHPGDKRTVAVRLAALALNRFYGMKEIPCDSPELKSWKVEGGAFSLKFANCGRWVMHGEKPAPFEVAGADGRFCAAEATFEAGGIVKVKAADVPVPVQLRYAWSWRRLARLKNEYGLPLAPFRILPASALTRER